MNLKVQKWGNSLALRIPKAVAKEVNVQQGSTIDLAVLDGKIVIEVVKKKKYCLSELLSRISEDNRHGTVETGEAVGKEVW